MQSDIFGWKPQFFTGPDMSHSCVKRNHADSSKNGSKLPWRAHRTLLNSMSHQSDQKCKVIFLGENHNFSQVRICRNSMWNKISLIHPKMVPNCLGGPIEHFLTVWVTKVIKNAKWYFWVKTAIFHRSGYVAILCETKSHWFMQKWFQTALEGP